MTAITSPGTSTPASDSAAAVCPCHGEPGYWQPSPKYRAGGWLRCAVRKKAQERARYEALSVIAYNRKLLKSRRQKALARQRQRLTGEGV